MSSIDDQTPERNNGSTEEPAPDHGGPNLAAVIDGVTIRIEPASLLQDTVRADLIQRCEQAAGTVEFAATNLFGWPDDVRAILLQLLASPSMQARLRIGVDRAEHANPFDAIVANLVGPADVQRCTAGRRAAAEAAAWFLPPDSWRVAANRIVTRMREVGVEGLTVNAILRDIRNVAGRGSLSPEAAATGYHEALRARLELAGDDPAIRYYRDTFYAWNGRHWERLDNSNLEARMTRYIQEHSRGNITRKLVTDAIANLKGETLLDHWNREMPFWIQRGGEQQTEEQAAEEPLWVGTPPLVVFENGMIDLQEELYEGDSRQMHPHDPNCFTTVMLPFDYDPEARCPLWEQTLAEILPHEGADDHRILVLQEFMGLTFFPKDTRFEKFLICVGKGANGKSTILRVWEALLGPRNVTHVPLDALASEFRLEEMQGKLANIASDMKRMDKMEEGRLKELTSGEPIQVNRKYKSPVTMVPSARLIFATNELPQIGDRSDGIWRRMIAMPFNVQFSPEQQDLQRVQRLLEELPGIFNWALAGAERLYAQQRFSSCAVCEACAGEHRVHSDPFLQFLEEAAELASGSSVLVDDLYQAYVAFCQRNGRKPKSSSEFGRQVLELPGVRKARQASGARKYEYQGIRLRAGPHAPLVGMPSRFPVPSRN